MNTNGVDLMIDLETLSTAKNAAIVSIGGVLFDPRANNAYDLLRSRAFYASVRITDSMQICGEGSVSGDTLEWWFLQEDAAIKALVDGNQMNLAEALCGLWKYTHSRTENQPEWHRKSPIPQFVWANSPQFDCTILRHACEKTKAMYPFHYALERDLRTLEDIAWPDGEIPKPAHTGNVKHNAADDAVAQAIRVQNAYHQLGLSYDNVKFIPNEG